MEAIKVDTSDYKNLMLLSQEGITMRELQQFLLETGLSLRYISEITPLSYRTLQRYRTEKVLDYFSTQRILMLLRVIEKGTTTFGSLTKFNHWFFRENRIFENKQPSDMMDNDFGVRLVEEELDRIEHGVFV